MGQRQLDDPGQHRLVDDQQDARRLGRVVVVGGHAAAPESRRVAGERASVPLGWAGNLGSTGVATARDDGPS